MEIRKFLITISLILLMMILSLLSPINLLGLVKFQFYAATFFYIHKQNDWVYILILGSLFVVDSIQGVDPSFSIIAFTAVGLGVSLLSKVLPIMKQYPFILARNIWVIFATLLFEILKQNVGIRHMLIVVLVNFVVVNLSIFIFENLVLRDNDQEITIS